MLNRKTIVKDGRKYFMVSTVQLPLEKRRYETMVFRCHKDGEWYSARDLDYRVYINEQDALEGHEDMVALWGDKVEDLI